MTTIDDILAKYRSEAHSARDLGDRFERLMRGYLLTDPVYASRFREVWLWRDFPFRHSIGVTDTGIDLVAETRDGDYWAIQCKFYRENHKIDKHDLDTFISTSGRSFLAKDGAKTYFSHCLVVSTAAEWTSTAADLVKDHMIEASRLTIGNLRAANVDWGRLENDVHGRGARKEPHSPRPHQAEAIAGAHAHFETHDRGKMVMACGTGKTFTALRIAEQEADGLALVLVPSIALVGQMLREWTEHSRMEIYPICVCSDPQVSRLRKAKTADGDDPDPFGVIDLGFPVTTDGKKVVKHYRRAARKAKPESLTVVFSTYQSIDVIKEAQDGADGLPEFGLIVCDEAHRTTGAFIPGMTDARGEPIDESHFIRVHDNRFVKGRKRLYMTATPRLYAPAAKAKAKERETLLCSMDDEAMYGGQFYCIGFGEAVEKELLTDYKVLIFTVRPEDVPEPVRAGAWEYKARNPTVSIPDDTDTKIVGCINALSKLVIGEGSEGLLKDDPGHMKTAVAFSRRIKDSQAYTELFNQLSEHYMEWLPAEKRLEVARIEARHIDGTMGTTMREERMDWLKGQSGGAGGACKILSNVRCLSEGVDVPALDAVIFLSPKNSQIDVVQSVGRVMRRAPGKKFGYIIIPIIVPQGGDAKEAMDNNDDYKVVWSVLNALKSHDDRFNATINSIELNKKRPDRILVVGCQPPGGSGGGADDVGDTEYVRAMQQDLNLTYDKFQELQSVIFATLVNKVGSRRAWEDWARDVADIAVHQEERIARAVKEGRAKEAFASFLREMRDSVDATINEGGAIKMLAQHTITAPVFEALFEDYRFAKINAVSVAMGLILDELSDGGGLDADDAKKLERFYKSVKDRASRLDNAEARETVIKELYNNFFKAAFPILTEKFGIVYTPVEVVDFIIRSADDVLRAEFGKSLSDRGVNILDPFAGTGIFLTRLIQSGLIEKKDLERKYSDELFANEIVLLAYYIACINIENAYHDVTVGPQGKRVVYQPFEGMALTDTFQAWEGVLSGGRGGASQTQLMFDQNTDRVNKQNERPITVIFGNPPYSIGQKSENDDAKNHEYEHLDKAIEESYASLTEAKAKRSLYDSYIRAFRYATDRLGGGDGIVCFVSGGGWLDSNSGAGFRKTIESEFAKIYVFNLRGNANSQGLFRKKEAGNVFGGGTKTPVAITLLVKRSGFRGKAEILYRDIGDYLKREEKLGMVKHLKTFLNPELGLTRLTPNEHGDWITTRNEAFKDYIPLAPEKKFDEGTESVFVVNSNGMNSQRDVWVWNYSKKRLIDNIDTMIGFYNSQLGAVEPDNDPSKISWSRALRGYWKKKKNIQFEKEKISNALYRPFQIMPFYCGERLIEVRYRFDNIFPTPDTENLVICVSGVGGNKDHSCLVSNIITDLNCLDAGTQCFPLHWYDSDGLRHDGLSDWMLERVIAKYGGADVGAARERPVPGFSEMPNMEFADALSRAVHEPPLHISKEDIFFYVYGFLHHPAYRTTFADDLKKSLPRIPLVDSADDFWAFSKAGRQLADLHLNYESVPPLPEVTVTGTEKGNFHVTKMRFPTKTQKDTIIYNPHITITNIPEKAYQYIVNGKPALEWVMERYQIKTDKDSDITNDPNHYAEESGQADYILNLLLSVISVSMRTVGIVEGLPEVDF